MFKARREEDRQHTERKKELRKQLQQFKQQIMALIEENSTLPDLEKLERYEFNLDEEERQKLIALGEQSVKQVSVWGHSRRKLFELYKRNTFLPILS